MFRTIVRLSARNALRKPVRTGLTVGMVVLGVALLVVGMSWIDGVFGQMQRMGTNMTGHVRIVTEKFADNEALMPLDENIPNTAPLVSALKAQSGVTAVYPRIATGVTITAGEEIGEFFALAVGAPEAYFRERLNGEDHLTQGRWLSGDNDELVIGFKIARQIEAAIGDEVVLLGRTQYGSMSPIKGTVVGITRGTSAIYNRQVWVPIEKMRWLADMADGATEVLVYGKHYAHAEALAAALASAGTLTADLIAQPWHAREPWRSMSSQIQGIRGVVVFFIIFLTALGIWNTMMMSVLERTHEIGVLRAMGLKRLGTVGLFVVEAITIAVLGGTLGVALGAIPAWLLETHGIHLGEKIASQMGDTVPISETVYGDLTVRGMAIGFAMGLIMALAGSIIPALRAAGIQPVTAMRTGR